MDRIVSRHCDDPDAIGHRTASRWLTPGTLGISRDLDFSHLGLGRQFGGDLEVLANGVRDIVQCLGLSGSLRTATG
jgi:hypothetical protein